MLHYPENIGSTSVTVIATSVRDAFYYSPANEPGHNEWPVGTWTVSVDVSSASSDMQLSVQIDRVDGSGAFIESYSLLSSPQNILTGQMLFTGTTIAQSAFPGPTTGHRIRVMLRFENFAETNGTVIYGFGHLDSDYVEVPILMGNPRVTWSGNTLTFPGPLTKYRRQLRSSREKDFSGGGVAAAQLHHFFFQLLIELETFTDAQFRSDLEAFCSWALQGKQFAFALDSADVVDLTLNGAAAAAQKDIPLADTSSVVVGREYRLREAAGPEFEIIKVASITTNVKAVAVNNLKFGYLTGDSFRSPDYFAKVVILDDDEPVEEHFTNWSLSFSAREDRG